MLESADQNRLAPLHGLRGMAALGVAVFFHYIHFGGAIGDHPLTNVAIVHWLYANGWLLVDLFFLLSGIIFTHRYLVPVAEGAVSGRTFLVRRLARLYPLHLFALLVCAGVEWTLLWFHQTPVIYPRADLYSFFLQAFYLHMAFWSGWAFNAPSWSVAAEILAYLSFFFIASRHPKRYVAGCIVMLLVGLSFETNAPQTNGGLLLMNGMMARALVGFYAGSLGYLAMRKAEQLGHARLFGWASLGAFVAVVVLGQRFGNDVWIGANAPVYALVVFPPLIFACLGVRPLRRALSLRPLVFLGDISYAIYLVHVPVQMIVLAVARANRITLPIGSPIFLAGYAATLLVTATLARYGIEKPASQWLRRHLLSRTAAVVETPALVPASAEAVAAGAQAAVAQ
jgi:peptidoglycan/LPS O-acetylase OafA/YrhL